MLSRDDVLRMAMEVDPIREQYSDGSMTIEFTCGDLVRFAALVAAHEREECCKLVYGMAGSDNVAERTCAAIRARAND